MATPKAVFGKVLTFWRCPSLSALLGGSPSFAHHRAQQENSASQTNPHWGESAVPQGSGLCWDLGPEQARAGL